MASLELLAPAGDLEKLRAAVDYGADAVYAGGEHFGLRAQAGNLDLAALAQGRDYCARHGVRLYLTLNAFLRPGEESRLETFLRELEPLGLDAYIVADPGVLATVRRCDPRRPLHLSTQASTTNAAALGFWAGAGVKRVNLARELSLAEIAALGEAAAGVELEVFVHGAMCVAWSGRCLLSAALTGRSANRGACTQPCRWNYAVVEETRPGEYFPLEEDDRGSYLFNSRDLCLIEELPALAAAGVASVKIEGRMKSVHYVAAVTRVYRAAIDRLQADPAGWQCDPAWLEELDKVSHRPYDKGFVGGGRVALVHPGDVRYRRRCDFLGVVEAVEASGQGMVAVRNRFFPGEQLEVIGPGMRQARWSLAALSDPEGVILAVAQPNARVRLDLPAGCRPGDLLRREKVAGEG